MYALLIVVNESCINDSIEDVPVFKWLKSGIFPSSSSFSKKYESHTSDSIRILKNVSVIPWRG